VLWARCSALLLLLLPLRELLSPWLNLSSSRRASSRFLVCVCVCVCVCVRGNGDGSGLRCETDAVRA
jgi:hypothetical protein